MKTQLGGLKIGFSKVRNQSFTEERVAKLDKNPTKRQAAMEIIILFRLVFFKGQLFNGLAAKNNN